MGQDSRVPRALRTLLGLRPSALEAALFPHVHAPWSLTPARQMHGLEGISKKIQSCHQFPVLFSLKGKSVLLDVRPLPVLLQLKPTLSNSVLISLSGHCTVRRPRERPSAATAVDWESRGRSTEEGSYTGSTYTSGQREGTT